MIAGCACGQHRVFGLGCIDCGALVGVEILPQPPYVVPDPPKDWDYWFRQIPGGAAFRPIAPELPTVPIVPDVDMPRASGGPDIAAVLLWLLGLYAFQ